MTGSEQSDDERVWQFDEFLANTMHEAVVKLAALNNSFFVLSVYWSGRRLLAQSASASQPCSAIQKMVEECLRWNDTLNPRFGPHTDSTDRGFDHDPKTRLSESGM